MKKSYHTLDDVYVLNDIKQYGHTELMISGTKWPFNLFGWEQMPNLRMVSCNITTKPLDGYVGKLLFNIETKQFCFGWKESSSGMVATTITDKGEFWNGVLLIVINI